MPKVKKEAIQAAVGVAIDDLFGRLEDGDGGELSVSFIPDVRRGQCCYLGSTKSRRRGEVCGCLG